MESVCMYYSMCLKVQRQTVGIFLSFYHVDSKNGTQIFRLGGKHPYLVSCFVCPVEAVCVHNVCGGNGFLRF